MTGVVLVSQFNLPGIDKDFSGMVDYMDRKEAIENENLSFTGIEEGETDRVEKLVEELKEYSIFEEESFSGMIDYMDRKKAKHIDKKENIALFDSERDYLNKESKNELKKKFDKAQSKGSIMWNDIISFDNKWLEEQGIYSEKSKLLDDKKLKEATRKAMGEMFKCEKISNPLWAANIHFNTDNIHIHIATVEDIDMTGITPRERGKRKPKTLEKMKSKIVNSLTDEKEIYKKINDIIRKDIVDSKKKVALSSDKATKELFKKAYSMLPENKRYWQYNYNSIKDVRPFLNKMTDIYIEKYHKESFSELNTILKGQQKKISENYGGENPYYENKMQDLYTRMGNSILKEMKDYSNLESRKKENISNNKVYKEARSSKGRVGVIYNFKKMKYYMNTEYEKFKNQISYENLQRNINHQNEKEHEYER